MHAQSLYKGIPSRPDPKQYQDIEPENYTEEDFNRTLPFDKGEYDENEIDEATAFFHLPKSLTPNFVSCKENIEYSCFELIRAYRATKKYMDNYKEPQMTKYVIADLLSNSTMTCRMASFYNAFLIAMFTNRRLILQTDEKDIAWLHPELKGLFTPAVNLKNKGLELPFNFSFSCEDVNVKNQTLIIKPCMWSQISYIHPYLAPRIRSAFGIHAAFYICNYLFNYYDSIEGCEKVASNTVVGVPHTGLSWKISTNDFKNRMVQCVPSNKTVVILEDDERSSDKELVCLMKKLMSSDRIIYTFGSTLGWMAMSMSMQRDKGAAVDLNGNFCFNFRNTQCGSMIHTYCPKKIFHYSSNNEFLLCGSNYNDARMYERYLMW